MLVGKAFIGLHHGRQIVPKDCVDNGHHRMGIALDLGLKKIPVRFCAAAAAPAFLRPLMRLFSTLNLAFKRRIGH